MARVLAPAPRAWVAVASLLALGAVVLWPVEGATLDWQPPLALSRARCCAGLPCLAERFERVRRELLAAPRDHAALRHEVQAMREKVRAARPVKPGLFDVKHSAGGMMDAEFAMQFLVLAHAAAHPELLDNVGNIALMQRAQACGLLSAPIGDSAARAYRELRRAQHRARLDEQPTQFPAETMAAERDAVLALWNCVFTA